MTKQYEILVVDDDMDIRDSLQIILEKNGYAVGLAKNGKEALREFGTKKPDLMILDMMMSTDTEGFDPAYELKNMLGKNLTICSIPIIRLGRLDAGAFGTTKSGNRSSHSVSVIERIDDLIPAAKG